MLLSEFENLTDIKPDSILYSVIEKEYNAVDGSGKDLWTNKAQFCHAYKFDEDGLATECQRIANNEIWRKDEQYRKAQMESANRITGLFNETLALRKELADAEAKLSEAEAANAELEHEIERLKEDDETACKTLREMKCDKRKADMFRVLEQYARDDVDVQDIGRAVIAYVDLLDWEVCYADD